MKIIHRRDAENAEEKCFSRSGDADLQKRLRLTGTYSNTKLCPKGCEAFGLSASQRQDKIVTLSVLSDSAVNYYELIIRKLQLITDTKEEKTNA